MRHFLIFFQGKEGTSPLVRLLNNFDQISIVHQVHNSGWEPFNHHKCGPIPLRSLEQCLEMIFNEAPLDIERLNRIYGKTAARPLESPSKNGSVGLKMRFRPPKRSPLGTRASALVHPFMGNVVERRRYGSFKRLMVELLKRNNLVAFFAVRQDVLRWALSRYHGDGTGRRGHLQFKLAERSRKDQIRRIYVDCKELEKMISRCEESHKRKQRLMNEFGKAGISVHPLLYEDFVEDRLAYFQRICDILEIEISRTGIEAALGKGAYFEKVHSDQISEFVENHQEVLERFGHRFTPWH